ncbi:hypothetical protein [Streptomyces sp. NPDC050704]|uniref:hypothetical protein n=1 Tax=Streptomyces sp. NPDC050704 TaxID=3157219 RepID=UPI00343B3237
MLALTACAVLAGATSVLAVSEWITDARRTSFNASAYAFTAAGGRGRGSGRPPDVPRSRWRAGR